MKRLRAKYELNNSANDANDFAGALAKLGFVVKPLADGTISQMDAALEAFGNELDNYDVGLFFYAGHGFQQNGQNYLTATDTTFTIEGAIRTSLSLDLVLNTMESASNHTNIIILDACREDLSILGKKRGISSDSLAPVFAPKGTIIAYSTSPGQTADDGLETDRNGVYTRALLANIVIKGIGIEEFFRNVRNSVSDFTSAEQVTWEHTSLTGKFVFNSGEYTHVRATKYAEWAVIDGQYDGHGDPELAKIIEDLKVRDFYTQGPALRSFSRMNTAKLDSNLMFIIGRNVLQSATGGEFSAKDFMEELGAKVLQFQKSDGNPVLEGILFEMYFDKNGLFREDFKGSNFLTYIDKLRGDRRFKKSFDFISDELAPFESQLFFKPAADETGKSINVLLEPHEYKINWKEDDDETETVYIVKRITFEGKTIMEDGDDKYSRFKHREDLTFVRFKLKVAELLNIPPSSLVVHPSIPLKDDDPVKFQWGVKLRKL